MVVQTQREKASPNRRRLARFIFQACFLIYVFTLVWLTLRPRPAGKRLPLAVSPARADSLLRM